MKSFIKFRQQLLLEYLGYVEWGFISPNGKVIRGEDTYNRREDSHFGMAIKLGFESIESALSAGYIRFGIGSKDSVAGFNCSTKREPSKVISNLLDFLKENRRIFSGLSAIYVEDLNHSITGVFESYRDAIGFLDDIYNGDNRFSE